MFEKVYKFSITAIIGYIICLFLSLYLEDLNKWTLQYDITNQPKLYLINSIALLVSLLVAPIVYKCLVETDRIKERYGRPFLFGFVDYAQIVTVFLFVVVINDSAIKFPDIFSLNIFYESIWIIFSFFYLKGVPKNYIGISFLQELSALFLAIFLYDYIQNSLSFKESPASYFIAVTTFIFNVVYLIPWCVVDNVRVIFVKIPSQIKETFLLAKSYSLLQEDDKFKAGIEENKKYISQFVNSFFVFGFIVFLLFPLLILIELIKFPVRRYIRNDSKFLFKSIAPSENEMIKLLNIFEKFPGVNLPDKVSKAILNVLAKAQGFSNPYLLSDGLSTVDILDRDKFVSDLYDIICKQFDSSDEVESLTIGLFDEWGSGKSYCVKQLKKLFLDKRQNIIPIETNPWQYFLLGDDASVLNGFFADIREAVNKHIGTRRLGNLFQKYAHLFQNSHISYSGFNIHLRTNYSHNEIKKKIEKELFEHKKKLLVIVEDLDRMSADELISTLRLLRSCSDFNNVIFLVVCDREKVVELLLQKNLPQDYLEKFINYEVYMPPVESKKLSDYFIEVIKDKWRNEDFYQKNERLVLEQINEIFSKFVIFKSLKNLRHMKRLLNGIVHKYPSLHGEVNLKDLVFLEILKQRFPYIYTHIVNYPEHYILHTGYKTFGKTAQERGKALKESLNAFTENLKISDANMEVAEHILSTLFRHYSEKWSYRRSESYRIDEPKYFYRYFMGQVPATQVRNMEVISIALESCSENLSEKESISLLYENLSKMVSGDKDRDFMQTLFVDVKSHIPTNFWPVLVKMLIQYQNDINEERYSVIRGDHPLVDYIAKALHFCEDPKLQKKMFKFAINNLDWYRAKSLTYTLDIYDADSLHYINISEDFAQECANLLDKRLENEIIDQNISIFGECTHENQRVWIESLRYIKVRKLNKYLKTVLEAKPENVDNLILLCKDRSYPDENWSEFIMKILTKKPSTIKLIEKFEKDSLDKDNFKKFLKIVRQKD